MTVLSYRSLTARKVTVIQNRDHDMGDMDDITDQIPPHGRRPGPHLPGGDVKTTFITDQEGPDRSPEDPNQQVPSIQPRFAPAWYLLNWVEVCTHPGYLRLDCLTQGEILDYLDY